MPARQRSRACQGCLSRKIKCDGGLPGCARCESIGIICSGPIVGPIIVPFNPKKRAQKSKAPPRKSEPAKDEDATPNRQTALILRAQSYSNVDSISELAVTRDVFAMKLQEVLGIPHQAQDSIISHLLKWSSSADMPVAQRAVWAVSAGVSANFTRNLDFSHKAKQNYMHALRGLRAEITRNEMSKKEIIQDNHVVRVVRKPISLEMIAVAAIFIWYEGCMSTTALAFIDHCKGAGKLLLSRQPEDFTSGHAFPIFRTVRFVVALHDLLMIDPSDFTAEPWMTIPYSTNPKLAMDRLTDFMLLAAIPLSWIDRECSKGLPIHRSFEAQKILENVIFLEEGLSEWWMDYQSEEIAKNGWIFIDIAPDSIDDNGAYVPMVREYCNDGVVECMAHYEICRLALSIAKAAFYDGSEFHTCVSEAMAQTAGFLAVIPWLGDHSTTHRAREFFGMLGPLIISIAASPSKLHRDYATFILYSWGPPDGLDGGARQGPMEKWSRLKGTWERDYQGALADVFEMPVLHAELIDANF